jgi:hypothetical protein
MCYIGLYTSQRPSIFTRDKLILSLEKMIHKNYGRKGSVGTKKGRLVVSLKRLGAKTS